MAKRRRCKILGGGGDADIASNLSFSGFVSGGLQNALSIKLENNAPCRSLALLSNAALQRGVIEASNFFFGYSAFPTFFGSEYCYIPKEDGLMSMPAQGSPGLSADADYFIKGLSKTAQRYPEITFYVCVADLSSYSAANPAMSLVSNPTLSSQDIANALQDSKDAPNIQVVDVSQDNAEAYFNYYYTSDHHWSGYGALQAFRAIMGDERDGASKIEAVPFLRNRHMNGSMSRSGLMLLDEQDEEPQLDLRGITALSDYDAALKSKQPKAALNKNPQLAEFDFYHIWYGPSANTTITNNREESGSALVIGDSYTSAIQWLIAQDYHRTTVFLDCHGSYKGTESIESRILSSSCNDVYFIMAPTGIQYLRDCYPHYWLVSE